MKPHFFGPSEEPLYGVYDEPRVDAPDAPAVLACYPIAGEYMRAHRAYRQLANLLTRRGAHVLRFDYSGTGDSFGEAEAATLDAWRRDIERASDELKELSGASRVKLAGLRLGATLGLLAASGIEAVDQVVLWDPIVSGPDYVGELEAKHLEEQRGRGVAASTQGTVGVNGFPITRPLRDEIAGIDLLAWGAERPARVDLVVSSEGDRWSRLREHLARAPNGGTFELSPGTADWGETDEFGSALIPQQIIQSVVKCLTEEAA